MPDTWQQRLRPASFRGVEFHVDVGSRPGGRRAVSHEFPKREDPLSEDMGRRAKRFQIEAYVVGDDYMDQRDAVCEAMDTEGPGLLIHPSMGELLVQPMDCVATERRERGRMAEIQLSFVEAGSQGTTAPTTDTQGQVTSAADNATTATTTSADGSVRDYGGKFTTIPSGGDLHIGTTNPPPGTGA